MRAALVAILASVVSSIAVAADLPYRFDRALVVGGVGRSSRSPVRFDAVEHLVVRGTFKSPNAGDTVTSPDGTVRTWESLDAKDGQFQAETLRGGYAFARFESDANQVAMLEASGHSMVYVNGEPRLGDPYGQGFVRLPVALVKGQNEFLFACGGGGFSAKLAACPSGQPFFLGADDTVPDLVVGEAVDAVLGLVVVNPTAEFLRDLVIEITPSGGGPATRTTIASLPPLSDLKVATRITMAAPSAAGALAFDIAIRQAAPDGERAIATRQLSLNAVEPAARRRVTFTSAIDGSAQYYSVVPPTTGGTAGAAGLILSLHGANVEADGQAACYAPKDFAYVVAPTNRRRFGFDWEDWGRLDALEVLADAQARFHTDSRRQWLTGHSMGGHGTWQIGAHYPERFAAIAPSAGWIAFRTYAGGTDFGAEGVEGIFRRASSPSDTLALKRNYAGLGVYVLHGDADDNVPVSEARAMRAALCGPEGFHGDFCYYERPGAGHWWGNECMDWPALVSFLAARTLPDPATLDHVAFTTSAPWVSGDDRWIRIDEQLEPMRPSSVDLRRDRTKGSFEGTTANVARLALRDIPAGQAPISVKIDATAIEVERPASGVLWLQRDGDQWKSGEATPAGHKRAERGGPFKEAFRNRVLFVVGTRGDDALDAALYAKARFDAETFWYRGNGGIEIRRDSDIDVPAIGARNVVLYGNAESNGLWPALLGHAPIAVRAGSVKLGDQELTGDDLCCLVAYPRAEPECRDCMVAAVAGTGLIGTRLAERMPYFTSGVSYPDCTVIAADSLLKGLGGFRLAGFFGNDWSVERGTWATAKD